jgi:RNA polymerase sigma factor (TIGR02999 family)
MASEPADAPATDPQGSDECSLEEITVAAYSELRRLASGYLHNNSGNLTLPATALVHEAYMRLAGQDKLRWRNRGHFFGIAARCMRQILVDHARARGADKRGGSATMADPAALLNLGDGPAAGILELDDALKALGQLDERKSRTIELHYFGGLNYEEMAEVLGVSAATVKRDLQVARAWLLRELTPGTSLTPGTK